jgi:hypothetical protein
MAALTGKKPKNTYKDLLQVSNSNAGIDGTLRFVSDGEGTDSTLKLSTASVSTTSKIVVGGDTAASDAAAIGYTSAEGLIITGQGSTSDITVKNDADAAVLTVATGTTNVDIVGDVTAATVNADGDTSASDNAAMGYTSAEGLILTGQGSTNDITIKNDADADVITVATGGTNVDIVGDVTAATVNADGDTSAGDDAAMGYTSAEGLILTGQGSTNDVTIKNDADGDVISIPTGTTNVTIAGDLTISGDDLTMGTNTSGAALIADGTNFNPVVISGDATVATNGALTIANDAVTSAKIADDAITSALIADDAVVTAAIADDAITAALIADDAVGSAAIADDAITSALIADDAITSALIADDAVVSAAIADNAVTTALINDDAVTLAKMAGLARGKIIYGDSSGDPAALAIGSNTYVLTSDGTDAAWAAAASGAVSSYTNSTDNRVITSVDSSTINGEANLTFDGSVLAVAGNVTATGTVEPAGDTSASDNAAIGYTSAEGIIITGQGSTNDVTIKNDADADVFTVPTGTTAPIISGQQMPSAGGLWYGRNKLINGGMTISQRNGTTLTATTNNTYFLDRWKCYLNGSCAVSTQQLGSSSTPAATLTTASSENQNAVMSVDCTTAASLGGTDLLGVLQLIEGYTSVPMCSKPMTLTFWVNSSVTGQYYVAFKIAGTRTYVAPYTISSADTWEKKTITLTMDTYAELAAAGGTAVTNSSGFQVYWGLRLGTSAQQTSTINSWHDGNFYGTSSQVTWGTSTSDTFYLGATQFEHGSSGTPFEHEIYSETLQKCQRYYFSLQKTTSAKELVIAGATSGATNFLATWPLSMRAAPTITFPTGSGAVRQSASTYALSAWAGFLDEQGYVTMQGTLSSSATANTSSFAYSFQTACSFSAEL